YLVLRPLNRLTNRLTRMQLGQHPRVDCPLIDLHRELRRRRIGGAAWNGVMPWPNRVIVDSPARRFHILPDLEIGHADARWYVEAFRCGAALLHLFALLHEGHELLRCAFARAELPDAKIVKRERKEASLRTGRHWESPAVRGNRRCVALGHRPGR